MAGKRVVLNAELRTKVNYDKETALLLQSPFPLACFFVSCLDPHALKLRVS